MHQCYYIWCQSITDIAFTQRERSHIRTQIWRSPHAPLPTHAITDVQKHTQERWAMLVHLDRILLCVMITTGGRNGHRETHCSGTGGRQKEWGWRRLRWGSRRSVSWHERDTFYNLSLSSFHAAGAQTLFPHFLPVFVLSALVLSFLVTADLPCFESPQTLWPRSEQRELTPSELLPGQFCSAVLKNRKK